MSYSWVDWMTVVSFCLRMQLLSTIISHPFKIYSNLSAINSTIKISFPHKDPKNVIVCNKRMSYAYLICMQLSWTFKIIFTPLKRTYDLHILINRTAQLTFALVNLNCTLRCFCPVGAGHFTWRLAVMEHIKIIDDYIYA